MFANKLFFKTSHFYYNFCSFRVFHDSFGVK